MGKALIHSPLSRPCAEQWGQMGLCPLPPGGCPHPSFCPGRGVWEAAGGGVGTPVRGETLPLPWLQPPREAGLEGVLRYLHLSEYLRDGARLLQAAAPESAVGLQPPS